MKIIRNVAPTSQTDDKISIIGLTESEYHYIRLILGHVSAHVGNPSDKTFDEKKCKDIIALLNDFDSARTRIVHI